MLLQNPFEFAASDAAAEQAVALLGPQPPAATADPFQFGAHTVSAPDETAVSLRPVEDAAVEYVDLDQTCFIGEIFVGAEKLKDPEARFVLDVQAFMDAIDEAPLFLRQASA